MYHIFKQFVFLISIPSLLCFCRGKEDIKFVESRIVSSNLDKVIISDTSKTIIDTIIIDLNKDSNPDYQFIYAINYKQDSFESPFYMYVTTLGQNELLLDKNPENDFLTPMKSGDEMNGRWVTNYGSLVNPPLNSHWENAGPKYLGYRLNLNNKFYIGWLKMEIGKKGSKIIFYDYAYRLDNANRMVAGER